VRPLAGGGWQHAAGCWRASGASLLGVQVGCSGSCDRQSRASPVAVRLCARCRERAGAGRVVSACRRTARHAPWQRRRMRWCAGGAWQWHKRLDSVTGSVCAARLAAHALAIQAACGGTHRPCSLRSIIMHCLQALRAQAPQTARSWLKQAYNQTRLGSLKGARTQSLPYKAARAISVSACPRCFCSVVMMRRSGTPWHPRCTPVTPFSFGFSFSSPSACLHIHRRLFSTPAQLFLRQTDRLSSF